MLDQANQLQEQIVAWRRHMHQHPELSGDERDTAAFVAERLREFGYEPTTTIHGSHGLSAELPGKNPDAPVTVLRADMDALPIDEQTELPYKSTNPGVMHACGHDAHTAMLLGAAKLLRDRADDLTAPVRFIFQPHEEKFPGGAPDLIAGGALKNAGRVFGIHICSNTPTGEVATRPGPFMAAVNPLRMRIIGAGGHAAMPETCIDPIVAASHIITALQTVVSRRIPITQPAVVSITTIHGGTADNVIPNSVELSGTIRTFDAEIRQQVVRDVTHIATDIAAAHHATAEIEIDEGYPVVVNDPDVTDLARDAARALGVSDARLPIIEQQGGGEDFAYYGDHAPAAFVFLGARNESKRCTFPHHHPQFDVDEDVFALGSALYAQVALMPS